MAPGSSGSGPVAFQPHGTTRASAGSLGGQVLGLQRSGLFFPLYRRCAICIRAPSEVRRSVIFPRGRRRPYMKRFVTWDFHLLGLLHLPMSRSSWAVLLLLLLLSSVKRYFPPSDFFLGGRHIALSGWKCYGWSFLGYPFYSLVWVAVFWRLGGFVN